MIFIERFRDLFHENTDQSRAGTLRVPSAEIRKTLIFIKLRRTECAHYSHYLDVISSDDKPQATVRNHPRYVLRQVLLSRSLLFNLIAPLFLLEWEHAVMVM